MFLSKNLSVLSYANGFTQWHYVTKDPQAIVLSQGYFAEARDMVRLGDLILTNTASGNIQLWVSEFLVTL